MGQRALKGQAEQEPKKPLSAGLARRQPLKPELAQDDLDLIPVPLWIEDYSGVKPQIDHFRSTGVASLRVRLDKRPQELLALVERILTVRVNAVALEICETVDLSGYRAHRHLLFGKDTYEILKERIVALAEQRTEFMRETVLTTSRGTRKNVLLHAKVDPSCARSLSRVFVTITDVTPVKVAEESLRSSEALYRQAFESAALPMMIVDALTATIVDANRPLQQLLGLPRLELLGAPIGRCCPDSGDTNSPSAFFNLASGRQPMIESLRLCRADGSEAQVAATARAVQAGNLAFTVLAFSPLGSSTIPWERREKIDRRAQTATAQKLSAREHTVLTLIATGHTNKAIAKQLGISHKTVETHRQRLMEKLGIHKATELVRYALTSGLVGSK